MTGSFITTTVMLHISRRVFLVKHQITQVTKPLPLQPRFGALQLVAFPKTKITFEREEISDRQWDSGKYDRVADGDSNKGFLQTILNSGRNTERTMWGAKVPTLKRTEASLSYVPCVFYLVSFSLNVSIFHITLLDTFWTKLLCTFLYMYYCANML